MVVPLEAPNVEGTSKGCATVDHAVVKQIMEKPVGLLRQRAQRQVSERGASRPTGEVRVIAAKSGADRQFTVSSELRLPS